jgi:phospholipid/cholesterol/gamma-HCH transport system substrate-binding protein
VKRRVLINLVFFVLVFFTMCYWAINNIVTLDAVEKPYTISGEFAAAAGVRSNSEVTYLGVHYGRVSGVSRRDKGVTVTMKIDKDKHIPAGSIARIFRKSAIGEPYVDFVPPAAFTAADTRRIEPGDRIPQARTTVPLEFSELLRSAGALVSSIDPDKAGSLVHELSLALDGRAQALRDLTTGFDKLTTTFASRTDELDRLAENNTRIVGVLADHRLSIGRSIANLRAVGDALRDSKGDLQSLLETGPKFLTVTADLVADQKRNLDCLLTDLAPVLRMAASPAHLADVTSLLRDGPTGFGYVFSALDNEPDGPWIRVNLTVPVGVGTDPKIYTPRHELPVVPTISPCASTLRAAAPYAAAAGPATTPAASATGTVAGRPVALSTSAAGVVRTGAQAPAGRDPMAVVALVLLAGATATLTTQRPRPGRKDR